MKLSASFGKLTVIFASPSPGIELQFRNTRRYGLTFLSCLVGPAACPSCLQSHLAHTQSREFPTTADYCRSGLQSRAKSDELKVPYCNMSSSYLFAICCVEPQLYRDMFMFCAQEAHHEFTFKLLRILQTTASYSRVLWFRLLAKRKIRQSRNIEKSSSFLGSC